MRKILHFFAVGLLLCVSILTPSLSNSVEAESSHAESLPPDPGLQSSWGEVDRLDIGTFDSSIIYLKENEPQRMYGYVYFSGDQTAINQAKVSFKDVDPDLTIKYDDDLVINGKTGSFSFTISLNVKDDREHPFTVTVGDGVADNNHLFPYSDTQTVLYDGTDTSDTTDSTTTTTSETTDTSTSETSSTSDTSTTTDSNSSTTTSETTDTSETSSTSDTSTTTNTSTSDTSAHSNTSTSSETSVTTDSSTSETTNSSTTNETSSTSESTNTTEIDSSSESNSTNESGSFSDTTSSNQSDVSGASYTTTIESSSEEKCNPIAVKPSTNSADKRQQILKTGTKNNRLLAISGIGLLVIDAVILYRWKTKNVNNNNFKEKN